MVKGKGLGSRILRFVETDIWEAGFKGLPRTRAVPLKCLRILVLAARGFVKDGCQKSAAVLTYYSVLNIVPLAAVAFAIAKGFGLEKMVEQRILDMAREAGWQGDIVNRIIGFSHSLLEEAKGGLIAGLAVILLLYTVVSILGRIEESFNFIWEVPEARKLTRKFSDYITMVVLAPLLLAVSGSITVVIASKLKVIVGSHAGLGQIDFIVFGFIGLLPYVSMWALLIMLYLVMPNTRVPVRSAVVGGMAAGTLFQLVQWVYIKFQIGVASYGAIYGSFAALPLFLGWLQMSWMIVLFGAELARADRCFESFGFHPDYTRLGEASLRLIALRIFQFLVRNFSLGEEAPSAEAIARAIEAPIDLVESLLRRLIGAGLVAEVTWGGSKSGGIAFQPARSVEHLGLRDFFDAFDEKDKMLTLPRRFREKDGVSAGLGDISRSTGYCVEEILVKDIQPPPETSGPGRKPTGP